MSDDGKNTNTIGGKNKDGDDAIGKGIKEVSQEKQSVSETQPVKFDTGGTALSPSESRTALSQSVPNVSRNPSPIKITPINSDTKTPSQTDSLNRIPTKIYNYGSATLDKLTPDALKQGSTPIDRILNNETLQSIGGRIPVEQRDPSQSIKISPIQVDQNPNEIKQKIGQEIPKDSKVKIESGVLEQIQQRSNEILSPEAIRERKREESITKENTKEESRIKSNVEENKRFAFSDEALNAVNASSSGAGIATGMAGAAGALIGQKEEEEKEKEKEKERKRFKITFGSSSVPSIKIKRPSSSTSSGTGGSDTSHKSRRKRQRQIEKLNEQIEKEAEKEGKKEEKEQKKTEEKQKENQKKDQKKNQEKQKEKQKENQEHSKENQKKNQEQNKEKQNEVKNEAKKDLKDTKNELKQETQKPQTPNEPVNNIQPAETAGQAGNTARTAQSAVQGAESVSGATTAGGTAAGAGGTAASGTAAAGGTAVAGLSVASIILIVILIIAVLALLAILAYVVSSIAAVDQSTKGQNTTGTAALFFERFTPHAGSDIGTTQTAINTMLSTGTGDEAPLIFSDPVTKQITGIRVSFHYQLKPQSEYSQAYLNGDKSQKVVVSNMKLFGGVSLPESYVDVNGKKVDTSPSSGYSLSLKSSNFSDFPPNFHAAKNNTFSWNPVMCNSASFQISSGPPIVNQCASNYLEKFAVIINLNQKIDPILAFGKTGYMQVTIGGDGTADANAKGSNLEVTHFGSDGSYMSKEAIYINPRTICIDVKNVSVIDCSNSSNGSLASSNIASTSGATINDPSAGVVQVGCPVRMNTGEKLTCTSGFDPNRVITVNGVKTSSPHFANDFVVVNSSSWYASAPFDGTLLPTNASASYISGAGQDVLIQSDANPKVLVYITHIMPNTAGPGISLSAGSKVKKDDRLGIPFYSAFQSKWWTGKHIHFEVRLNGVKTNPEDYIKTGCNQPNYSCK